VTPLSNAGFVDHLTESVRYVLPEVTLVGAACVLFLFAALRTTRGFSLFLALAGVGSAAAIAVLVPERTDGFNPVYGPIDPTGAASFVRWVALAAAAGYVFLGWADAKNDTSAEYHACVLVVAAGLSLVGRANDLVSLFLALELISIPTYVLLYLPSRTKAGQESAMKYFLLSVLSSGVLLFGFSYLFGLVGSTNLPVIVSALSAAQPVSPLALVGMILVIAGLGFRIAAVPFHFYAPDVYEGGPTGVVAQLAFVPKAAGFVALARLLGVLSVHSAGVPFDTERTLIPLTLWVMAVVTMSFGNLLALIQDNLKRLFAYSGIAHGGYMLIGVLVACSAPGPTADHSGMDAVLFYLTAYGFMTVGALAVIAYLAGPDRPVETVDDLAGLGRTNPFAALLMAVFFFSLIGLPLTAGFVGKFNLFVAAFEVPTETKLKSLYRVLAVVAAVNSAVSAVYYLRAVGVMFLRTPLKPAEPARGYPQLLAATACAAATLVFGAYPQPLMNAVNRAAPVPHSQATADAAMRPAVARLP
jgi:NADH-quinone oxidoreductase subunit N